MSQSEQDRFYKVQNARNQAEIQAAKDSMKVFKWIGIGFAAFIVFLIIALPVLSWLTVR